MRYAQLNSSEIVPTTSYAMPPDIDGTTTIVVRGLVKRTGQQINAAVMCDARGRSIESPDAFEVSGVDNFESADMRAASEQSDSFRALLECDLRAIAERYVADLC